MENSKLEKVGNTIFRYIFSLLTIACIIGGLFNHGLFIFALCGYLLTQLMK